MNIYIPILIIIFLLLLYLNVTCNIIETFIGEEKLVTDNFLNVDDSINISNDKMVKLIDNIKKTNKIDKNIVGINNNIALVIDPYINYYIFNNDVSAEKYKDGIFVCLSNIRLGVEKCIWDFKNKVIAYVSMTDYLFIQALIKAYRQDIKKLTLIRVTPRDLKQTSKKLFDYMFTYVVLDSEYMNYLKNINYFINGLNDVDINRIKAFYPFIEENYSSVRNYFSKDPNDKSYDIYLSNKNSLIPTMKYDVIRSVENFITRLELPDDYLTPVDKLYVENNKKGNYGCYGNEKITNKFECDSYYNYDGSVKQYYSKWDKKCESNSDCPYYKSNKNYPNSRGGCNDDGYCEFPVGVKRIGYTKYKDTGVNRPLCYNCGNTTYYDCCGTIDEDSNNKDYVFENDFNDRKKYKLNTIISLLDYRDSYKYD